MSLSKEELGRAVIQSWIMIDDQIKPVYKLSPDPNRTRNEDNSTGRVARGQRPRAANRGAPTTGSEPLHNSTRVLGQIEALTELTSSIKGDIQSIKRDMQLVMLCTCPAHTSRHDEQAVVTRDRDVTRNECDQRSSRNAPRHVETRPKDEIEDFETVLFGSHAKLYQFMGKNWEEIGTGYMMMIEDDARHVRILMRSSHTPEICANHRIKPQMNIEYVSNKRGTVLVWKALDYARSELNVISEFCCRFESAKLAAGFKDAFEYARTLLLVQAERADRAKRNCLHDTRNVHEAGRSTRTECAAASSSPWTGGKGNHLYSRPETDQCVMGQLSTSPPSIGTLSRNTYGANGDVIFVGAGPGRLDLVANILDAEITSTESDDERCEHQQSCADPTESSSNSCHRVFCQPKPDVSFPQQESDVTKPGTLPDASCTQQGADVTKPGTLPDASCTQQGADVTNPGTPEIASNRKNSPSLNGNSEIEDGTSSTLEQAANVTSQP